MNTVYGSKFKVQGSMMEHRASLLKLLKNARNLVFRKAHSHHFNRYPGTWNIELLGFPNNIRTKILQTRIDVLITAVDLLNIVNGTLALCRKCGNEQGYSGTYIR